MSKKVKKQNGGSGSFFSLFWQPSNKLIGNGVYGCVINPPVTKNEVPFMEYLDDKRYDDVGKLFKKSYSNQENFKEEKKNALLTHDFDPGSIFTVKLKGANKINSNDLSDEIRKCINVTGKNEDIYQLIYENGGIPLDKIKDRSITFSKFVELISRFLYGMKQMQEYGLCHRDIKPDNVLISDEKMNLIDFGLSDKLANVYIQQNSMFLQHISTIYPPEFYIASLLIEYRNDKIKFRNELSYVIDKMEQKMFDHIIKDSEGNEYRVKMNYFEILFEKNIIDSLKDDIRDFLREIRIKNESFSEVFNADMARKCDIFSLLYIFKVLSKKVKITNEIQQRQIKTLIMMCKEFNPKKRATIDDLISFVEEMKEIAQLEMYGGKLRRCLKIPKIHNNKCSSERTKGYKCKMSNNIKKNIKLL